MEFEKVFKELFWLVEVKAKRFSETTGEDKQDLISYMQYEFWQEWLNYDKAESDFKSYIDYRLNQRAIDYVRKKSREFNRGTRKISELEGEDEDGNPIELEFIDHSADVEKQVVDKIKTDEDKRQLIFALVKDSDSLTTAIVNEFLTDANTNPTAVGKKIGVHNQTVIRKLSAIRRNYYANKSEDISDFLAV